MEHAHILVVDDSEITGFKLKAILIRLGYTVSTFTNPIKALDWLRNPANIADLILTDVNMPEMNGVDLVKSLRRLPGHASTPVIMLTSNTEMEDKIAGLQAGADDYLGKTVSPTELELRVKALLARNQSKETNFSQSVARTITVFSLRGERCACSAAEIPLQTCSISPPRVILLNLSASKVSKLMFMRVKPASASGWASRSSSIALVVRLTSSIFWMDEMRCTISTMCG